MRYPLASKLHADTAHQIEVGELEWGEGKDDSEKQGLPNQLSTDNTQPGDAEKPGSTSDTNSTTTAEAAELPKVIPGVSDSGGPGTEALVLLQHLLNQRGKERVGEVDNEWARECEKGKEELKSAGTFEELSDLLQGAGEDCGDDSKKSGLDFF
jgi:hypothetical protein